MNHKPKKCKGQGKAQGVKGCGEMTLYRKFGLCSSCLSDWLFSSDSGKLYYQKVSLKVKKPRLEMEAFKKEYSREKTIKNLIKSTRAIVHKFIKIRDQYKPCISCGKQWSSNFHAGHYHKAELYRSLIFDLNNIHGQCPECNIHKEGNLEGYSVRLPERIGTDLFNELQKKASFDKQIKNFRWETEQLEQIKKEVKKLIKDY